MFHNESEMFVTIISKFLKTSSTYPTFNKIIYNQLQHSPNKTFN